MLSLAPLLERILLECSSSYCRAYSSSSLHLQQEQTPFRDLRQDDDKHFSQRWVLEYDKLCLKKKKKNSSAFYDLLGLVGSKKMYLEEKSWVFFFTFSEV